MQAPDPLPAELAELAAILVVDPPRPDAGCAARLDERMRGLRAAPPRPWWRPRLSWPAVLAPAGALAAGVVAAVVIGASAGGGAGGAAGASSSSSAAAASMLSAPAHRAPSNAAAGALSKSAAPGAGLPLSPAARQVVQSAQLQLSAPPSDVQSVAQEVFGVIGAEAGIVNSSNVTAGGAGGGSAVFQLSVPSAHLDATMTALSRLHDARVVSRTDATNDITGQVGGAGRRLAEARALRRSLLRQLAAATTTAQVDSLQARLHDADASIASDLSTLRGLKRQVAYSSIALTIQAAAVPPPVHHGGGFTLGRAAHDAGRVLVVVAGGALIVLAALVPVALLAALGAWVAARLRRRRRDQALDLV